MQRVIFTDAKRHRLAGKVHHFGIRHDTCHRQLSPFPYRLHMLFKRISGILEIHRRRPQQLAFAIANSLLNNQLGLSFQSNPRLRLIIVRPVEAAKV
ncbi:MAG: hypothetical protein AW09_001458 [Candidatus Accumulibacter phosphatis]|uniref:Uncharacterized protein n=1 Tax=Candidatus Accumulibacter phosphatis TaxID=327160 RepID=A0A080LX76_9PROT|nr:MAG: hypothetical protein AW09_001458 [Candidatus Accumulibacter phosphatis]